MGSRGASGNGGSKFGFRKQENRVTIPLSSKSKQEKKEIKRKLVSELDLVRRLVKKIEEDGSRSLNPLKNPLNNVSVLEKSKTGRKKQGGTKTVDAKFSSKLFKSCGTLLERLMKHKHGWVFNVPVDPLALGLHDYFDIIKNPMDLGTVKSRLDKNWYNSPMEFAEDVRVTFHNAMTYNPKGQDVYAMAEILLNLFEEKWKVLEADYIRESGFAVKNGIGLPVPSAKHGPPQLLPELNSSNSKSFAPAVDSKAQPTKVSKVGRIPSLKKPKAKEVNKREMTYDEKQKLSMNLQELPCEKLDHVVQIIKKRTPSLSQKDDEIEVDIDTFDAETLWELDRFVTNYKKSLSKNKRKAEFPNDERTDVESEFPNQERIEVESELPNQERIEAEPVFPNHERTEMELEFPNQEKMEVESEFPNQERTEAESEYLDQEKLEAESEFPNQEKADVESEIPNQERIEIERNIPDNNLAPIVVDAPKDAKTDKRITSATSPAVQAALGNKSSSSSSSSSVSGSSSSDSDSGSSSGEGSDAGHSSKA